MLQTKHIAAFDLKKTTPEGVFEGLLSPYGNVDSVGDIVEPGAYSKNLAEKGNLRPLLWQHQTDVPIGELTLRDRAEGRAPALQAGSPGAVPGDSTNLAVVAPRWSNRSVRDRARFDSVRRLRVDAVRRCSLRHDPC